MPNQSSRILPHPRTLRLAREQVKTMVADGISAQKIRRYLKRWALWWATTSNIWTIIELLTSWRNACWEEQIAAIATELIHDITASHIVLTADTLALSN